MLFNIAICDDNPAQIDVITSFIEKIDTKYRFDIIKAYSGEELLSNIKDKKLDIAFLDIEMDGMNGIELGEKIREKSKTAIIVFITGFKEYAFNAFKIKAFDYIMKPITEEKFNKLMNEIILRYNEQVYIGETKKYYIIKRCNDYIKISYKDIYFFEKKQRKIIVYTSKGEYDFYGTIRQLKKDLDMDYFIQCHQGFIVNKFKIFEQYKNEINFRDINKSVPISKRYYSKIRQALEDNLFL